MGAYWYLACDSLSRSATILADDFQQVIKIYQYCFFEVFILSFNSLQSEREVEKFKSSPFFIFRVIFKSKPLFIFINRKEENCRAIQAPAYILPSNLNQNVQQIPIFINVSS